MAENNGVGSWERRLAVAIICGSLLGTGGLIRGAGPEISTQDVTDIKGQLKELVIELRHTNENITMVANAAAEHRNRIDAKADKNEAVLQGIQLWAVKQGYKP